MVASAGGLDLLVFTGGVGEHDPELRSAVAHRLAHLGVDLDEAANDVTRDADITARGATACTVVVRSAEDVEISREVCRVLG
jgi:acetate kinase